MHDLQGVVVFSSAKRVHKHRGESKTRAGGATAGPADRASIEETLLEVWPGRGEAAWCGATIAWLGGSATPSPAWRGAAAW